VASTKKTSQASKQRQIITDYKSVFETAHGRRVLYDLMKAHHVVSSTHVTGDADATSFNEGARNVVLRIMTYLKYDIEKFDEAIKQGESENGDYDIEF